jgi:hypothetical protein
MNRTGCPPVRSAAVIEAIAGAVLLVAAALAMGAAALRAASLAAPGGLERAVAAAPLAVAAAVAEALALGAFGLGGSQVALALAAGVTWLAAWRWLPSPALRLRDELTAWTRSAPLEWRLAAAGALGLWAGWLIWQLRFPYLGLDGSTYHLAAVADWVTNGATGHSADLYASIPVGSYPLTGEVAIGWGVGLAHSFAPVAAWGPSVGALLVASSWLGLRTLAVPRSVAGLAIAALVLVPVVLRGLVQVETDVPALAWLLTAAALAACARARPGLLAPMLVAAALAIGTKTTVLPLTAIALVAAGWRARRWLRPLAVPLVVAAVLGFAAGGLWYLRNLLAHGSPLWPFLAAPWGDPVPPLLARVDYSLLERPRATLEGQLPIYRAGLSGGLVLLGGGLLAGAWARRREVAAASALTLLALLAWASAPFTGAGAAPFLQVNTLRYLIPAMAAGALALALSGRFGSRAMWFVTGVLVVAVGWSAKTYADTPYLPGEGTLVGAALAVGVLAVVAGAIGRRRPLLGAAAAALAMVAVLGFGGRHYVERHARAGDFDSGVVAWFTGQPAWRSGNQPIAFSPTPIGPLAGNRLRHPLELVGPHEPCAAVRARLTDGWVAVRGVDRNLFGTLAAERCLAGLKPVYDDGVHRVYGGP